MNQMLSFERMLQRAGNYPGLAMATSFIQVEYGIRELEAHWDGFVDSMRVYRNVDESEINEIRLYNAFTEGLEDFIECSLSFIV
jgi:hypothetical protein